MILTCWIAGISKLTADCSCFRESISYVTHSSPLVIVADFYPAFKLISTTNQPDIPSIATYESRLTVLQIIMIIQEHLGNHTRRWWKASDTCIFRVITVVSTSWSLGAAVNQSCFCSNACNIIKVDGSKSRTIPCSWHSLCS